MATIKIPYQYINNEPIDANCGEAYLSINNDDYQYCGDKPFAFQIVSSMVGANGIIENSYIYNDNLYTDSTLPTADLISLISQIFTCPSEYGCLGQVTSFNWHLIPVIATKWRSTAIVNNVQAPSPQPDLVYKIDVTVNAIPYGNVAFWDDTVDGNASIYTRDYIDAVIAHIESLSIPEYQGAVNNAQNNMSNNLGGVGLLDLYFDSGATVVINISEPTIPITGTFTSLGDVTTQLYIHYDNTSTLSAGDILNSQTFYVTDGVNNKATNAYLNTGVMVGDIFVWSIYNGQSFDETKGWVLTSIIVTENICERNNYATGVITSVEIIDAIDNQISQNGASIQ